MEELLSELLSSSICESEGGIMFIKLKDVAVLYFDLNDFIVEVIREDLLPFGIRGKLCEDKTMKGIIRNIDVIREWLSSRVLSLSRDNAKNIYTLFGLEQDNSIANKVKICLLCKAVSIIDSYWVGEENDKWCDFNIRRNKFTEIVDISLCGEYPSITADIRNPELTTKGLFRKAWIREDDSLFLLKSDKLEFNENTVAEVVASRILDNITVDGKPINKVDYELLQMGDMKVAKCKCFVNDDYSFVEARYLNDYCNAIGINYEDFCISNFGHDFCVIPLVDYIIMNTDRHSENYGFFMDNTNGCLVGVVPLFDHNLSLISALIGKDVEDTLSQMFNGYSILSLKDKYVSKFGTDYIQMDIEGVRAISVEYPEFKQAIDNVISRYNKIKRGNHRCTNLFN